MIRSRKRLGEILQEAGLINEAQLKDALRYHREKGGRLGEAFVELNILSERDLNRALSKQLGIQQINLKDVMISTEVLEVIGESIIRQHKAIPFYMDNQEIRIAVSNPLDIELEDKIADLTDGLLVKPYLATMKEIDDVIQSHFNVETDISDVQDSDADLYQRTKIDLSEKATNPIIALTNQFFRDAINYGASDIHLDPEEDKTVVKFRVDGHRFTYKELPKAVHNRIVIRIKNSAGLDFTKVNIPQDGRTSLYGYGNDIDLRIATLPTTNGEKVTIRLLDKSNLNLDLSKVGFYGDVYQKFLNLLKKKSGIILVSGETGSGKSSLCYAMLNTLNNGDANILTVEDPVEYELAGVNQVHINEKAGLTFATTLRSFLRSDPNIIFVGEMRDAETAEIAVRSAITGHVVLSTIHTNSSAGTISRLIDMGIEPHLVAESIVGIVNQRLVSRICSSCKVSYEWTITKDIKERFHVKEDTVTLYRGKGCSKCNNTGYKGRIPVQELLIVDERLATLIKQNATAYEIEQKAKQYGFINYREDAWNKTKAGLISLEVMKGEILLG